MTKVDVTIGSENIFEDLGFSPVEAAELQSLSRGKIRQEMDILCAARETLEVMRDTPAGFIPCDHGEYVRIEDASRYFQWHTLNRILAHLQTFEENEIPRKLLFEQIMEMRPTGPT